MKNMLPRHANRAFTLIELLVAISIMAILMGLIAGMVSVARNKAAISSTESQMNIVKMGLETHKEEIGDYPDCSIDTTETDADKKKYEYQQSSYVLWDTLVGTPSDPPAISEGIPYNDKFIDANGIDPGNVSDYVDDNSNGSYDVGEPAYNYGLLDYWGQPMIYMYWPGGRSGTAPPAIPGFTNSYELWSMGPDGEFVDFKATAEDDEDADNISDRRMPPRP